jgi:hypothetical protein
MKRLPSKVLSTNWTDTYSDRSLVPRRTRSGGIAREKNLSSIAVWFPVVVNLMIGSQSDFTVAATDVKTVMRVEMTFGARHDLM